ncbi:hypothetical protein F4806DRAFT_492155 [Annulohypoxylon nitens]|nr:hypothetical protein F4806DRAFT_492155 [Annulohypoxylon nitens]
MRFATTFRDTVSILKQLFPLLLILFRGLYASYEAIKSIKTKFLDHIPMSLSDLASHTQAMPAVQRQDLIRAPPSSDSDEARGDTNAPAPAPAENEQKAHNNAEDFMSPSNNLKTLYSPGAAINNLQMHFVSGGAHQIQSNSPRHPGIQFIINIASLVCLAGVVYLLFRAN